MSDRRQKAKLVRDIPDCKPLTPETLWRIASEAKAWQEAFSQKVAAMEKLSADDFKIRVR